MIEGEIVNDESSLTISNHLIRYFLAAVIGILGGYVKPRIVEIGIGCVSKSREGYRDAERAIRLHIVEVVASRITCTADFAQALTANDSGSLGNVGLTQMLVVAVFAIVVTYFNDIPEAPVAPTYISDYPSPRGTSIDTFAPSTEVHSIAVEVVVFGSVLAVTSGDGETDTRIEG